VSDRFYLGIDVGTGSARAAIFDDAGKMHGSGEHVIATFRPAEDYVEQSSEDIWRACGAAVRAALGTMDPARIRGIGFDATCSLVALGDGDRPVSVSTTGKPEQNVIVWMDHRAMDQAARINQKGHEVLKYVGGVISPEMEVPKLLWLKENLPKAWQEATQFFDLPDYLSYRATGSRVRSLCTTVCKWTYLAHKGGWQDAFFRDIGLGDLVDASYTRVGTSVRPMGERAGLLSDTAARDLGLVPGIPVSVSIIDAHAGGLGLLGAGTGALDSRLALIGGTSSCHMAVSEDPRFVPGVWGPYYSAMVPGMWLAEGGQSATGALIDHVIHSHARAETLMRDAKSQGKSVYALLNERALALAAGLPYPAALTRDVHVLPDHHGNRSPRANASLRGMVSGLKLSDSIDSLAILYVATVQAVAHGTKHILDTMNAHGFHIDTLIAAGGDTKSELFLREHADVTGCKIVLPKEREAVLLGSAMMGAVAAGDRTSLTEAMQAMSTAERVIEPARGTVAEYHQKKHAVFLRMHDDQLAYRALMG
jgi:FGGY-family pentulose kinase